VTTASLTANTAGLAQWQLDCLTPLAELAYVIPAARIVTSTHSAATPRGSESSWAAPWRDTPTVGLDQAEAAAQIKALDLDFILTWTDEPAVSALAGAARLGLWRYQLGDWEHFRGEPDGFWEVYDGLPVSTAMLVRVQGDLDSFTVLREAHVRTQMHSWKGNREQLRRRCAAWAAQLCVDIHNGELQQFSRPAIRGTSQRYTPPAFFESARYAVQVAARIALTAARSLLCHEQWNVGVIEQPIAELLESSRVNPTSRGPTRWPMPLERFEFVADPFGVLRDGHLTVLCEYLSYHDNRGTIVSLDPTTGRTEPVQIGPSPPVHLSYPCLIELDGKLLCIPETHEAREVALYELERFPDRWRKVATLIGGTQAVDATPFQYEGLWWLAASMPAPKGANCELHLWYSQAITGPWVSHAVNPVKVDVRSARPGGTPFMHEGVLYRPAQDCSTTYGARAIINRVVTLTPTAFREEFAASVDPDPDGPYPDGLHTVSAAGDITLIDGKRLRFVPAQFRRQLAGWVRGALKRLH
jgi:hypothetical protein